MHTYTNKHEYLHTHVHACMSKTHTHTHTHTCNGSPSCLCRMNFFFFFEPARPSHFRSDGLMGTKKKASLRKAFFLVPVRPPVRFEGSKITLFFSGRAITEQKIIFQSHMHAHFQPPDAVLGTVKNNRTSESSQVDFTHTCTCPDAAARACGRAPSGRWRSCAGKSSGSRAVSHPLFPPPLPLHIRGQINCAPQNSKGGRPRKMKGNGEGVGLLQNCSCTAKARE